MIPDVKINENIHPIIHRIVAVFFLDHPSLLEVVLNIGSRNPRAEVTPANSMDRNSISSGLQEILSPTRQDISVQVRMEY